MTIKVELNILIFTEFLQIRSDFTKALSVISIHQICDLDHLKKDSDLLFKVNLDQHRAVCDRSMLNSKNPIAFKKPGL